MWVNFEANHDDTKKSNSVRVLHYLVTKFLKSQLIGILWNAGANAYRKQENSFYFKLFLYWEHTLIKDTGKIKLVHEKGLVCDNL